MWNRYGKVIPFSQAYDSYYAAVREQIVSGQRILEVGGGAHPSIVDRAQTEYTIVDPDEPELAKALHESVLRLLTPGGKAIHFFACRNSVPAWVNRFLPEQWGEAILRQLQNRDLANQPKYEAYYQPN